MHIRNGLQCLPCTCTACGYHALVDLIPSTLRRNLRSLSEVPSTLRRNLRSIAVSFFLPCEHNNRKADRIAFLNVRPHTHTSTHPHIHTSTHPHLHPQTHTHIHLHVHTHNIIAEEVERANRTTSVIVRGLPASWNETLSLHCSTLFKCSTSDLLEVERLRPRATEHETPAPGPAPVRASPSRHQRTRMALA